MTDFTYVLPLDTSNRPSAKLQLQDFRAFLQHTCDIDIIDLLVKYDVPVSFQIVDSEDGTSLCIAVNTVEGIPAGLPDHFAAILGVGMGEASRLGVERTKAETDLNIVVKNALACDDVFVIHGVGDLSPVFAELVGCLIGSEPLLCAEGSFESYKKRVASRVNRSHPTAQRLEALLIQSEQYAMTLDRAREDLREAFMLSVSWADRGTVAKINEIIGEIPVQGRKSSRIDRLTRSVYSLPHHPIIYEDNGASVIEETLARLKEPATPAAAKELTKGLAQLAKTYDASDEWFTMLKELRKNLMATLTPAENPFVSNETQQRISNILKELHGMFLQKSEEENASRVGIINWFLQNLDIETLDKHRLPADGTKPFVLNGVAVIDMDACTDEAPVSALSGAKRAVLLGRHRAGLFDMFYRGAKGLEKKDGQTRVVMFGNEPEPVYRYWMYPSASSLSVEGFVYKCLDSGQSVGVLSRGSAPDFCKEFANVTRFKAGNLRDFYHDVFDVLILRADGGINRHDLSIAKSKALHSLVVIGDPMKLHADSPLRDFYHSCVGDDTYGRIYR